jgi:RNA polymerase sigma factor (sigma-70 family)
MFDSVLVKDMKTTCPPGTRQQNDQLYPLVVQGDPSAMRTMIEANLSLAVKKIDSYIVARPKTEHLRADMTSEAFLEIVKAVRRLVGSKTTKKNPTGYLSFAIRAAITKIVNDRGISMSSATAHRRRKRKQEIPKLVAPKHDRGYTPNKLADVQAAIVTASLTDRDREIVSFRYQGYTDPEIAKQLDISTATVFASRQAIYRRFNS